MTVTSIDANPPIFQVLTTELIPFTMEWADLVGIGQTVSSPSAVMYDNANGIQVTNAGQPSGFVNNFGYNGTQAQYIIDGSTLQAGHFYTAILTVVSNSQTFKQRIVVSVPR